MDIKQFVTEILNEAKPVSGDQAANNIAKGNQAVTDVKARLSKMGVYDIPELKGINTIEQLSIEPFKFSFLLQVDDEQQELTLPKPIEFATLARVVKKENPFTLEIKTSDGDLFMLQFDDSELVTNLPGTQNNIKALVSEDNSKSGKFYNVKSNNDLKVVLEKEINDDGDGEKTPCEKLKVDDYVNYKGKLHIVRKVNTDEIKEGLVQIQLSDDEQVVGNKRPLFAVNCSAVSVVEVGESEGEEKKEEGVGSNGYSGEDIDDVNNSFTGLKQKAKYFTKINKYKGNPKFKELFFNSLVGSKSIKVNGEPLLTTLGRMKKVGLLEAETEKESKLFKANLQNFMNSTYLLFAKLNENGKDSQTYKLIKNFYKELYLLSLKTPNNSIYTKVITTFQKFLRFMNELPELSKFESKEKGKKLRTKKQIKATGNTIDNMSEYYINNIADNVKLIFEADEDKKESNDFICKIYVKKIVLGPKAKAKRGEDETAYANSKNGGGQGSWDGLVNSLPPKGLKSSIRIELLDDGSLSPEQKLVFREVLNVLKAKNFNDEVIIRKSKSITDNTVFVIEYDKKALVCKVAQGANLKKPTEIQIGPKAAGKDIFDKSIKAKIQIS